MKRKGDFYYEQAKKENWLARSVFKLEELDQKFKLFTKGDKVLDLGAAPGSWSQFLARKLGPTGLVVALDLVPLSMDAPNVLPLQLDIRTLDPQMFRTLDARIPDRFSAVLSDMAPKTSGIRVTDHYRSLELCEAALRVADLFLIEKGVFVCKLLDGEGFSGFRLSLRERFKSVSFFRPKSTRKVSTEIYCIAR
jgi:23S rRNA (uridine2552-2'-O)-methyltransferase